MMRFWVIFALLILLWGCVGGISRQLRQEAYPLESFSELHEHPDEYVGEIVILGGRIIETRNTPDGTTLLILERPLGLDRRPKRGDSSGGRFMVRFDEYLDPETHPSGRRVTVAGRVSGTEREPVGEAPYSYVVLEGEEIRVWEEYRYYYGYPRYRYYGRFGYHRYRGPHIGRHHLRHRHYR